jgi:Uma2 family endonuclease
MSDTKSPTPITDRSLFSMHPEDWVPQRGSHDDQCTYFKSALRMLLPDCYVARDQAVYWVPGQFEHPYVGPDIFVSRQQLLVENAQAWLVYEDGPLDLVIEVACDATRDKEQDKRDNVYAAQLKVPEYVYVDLHMNELRLERLVGGLYEPVAPDAQGWLWSARFGVGFVRPAGERLARVVTRRAEIVPTAQEMVELRRQAELRAADLSAEVERLRRLLNDRDRSSSGRG